MDAAGWRRRRIRNTRPVSWTELAVLLMLAGLVVFGLAANGATLGQALAAIGFGTPLLVIAWMWQRTVRQAETE